LGHQSSAVKEIDMGIKDWIAEKVLRISPNVYLSNDITEISLDSTYDAISALSRCIDMIVNSCVEVPLNVYEFNGRYYKPVEKRPGWANLLTAPSKDTDPNTFYKQIYRDFIFKGNSLLYNTRVELQHIPEFYYDTQQHTLTIGDQTIKATDDFIFIKLLHGGNSFFAKPYLDRISDEISLIKKMLAFQDQYYRNNGIPGVILKTDRPLSSSLKSRLLTEFKAMTSILHGKAGEPYILDGGIEIEALQRSFRDLEFRESLDELESRIIRNLGVPEVLIKGGNNANITPNIKLFYNFTIKPFVETVASALTHHVRKVYKDAKKTYFIRPDFDAVQILREDFNSYSSSVKGLFTVGIISRNEARELLRMEKVEEDMFITPANIAGSAQDPSQGGRPSGGTDEQG